ncbi:acetyl esterase/lipase [Motilibacter peucedani]|uniref:Acetyl esterase/lipase n=1 Tax=Motilibacter peucedani TaxID=598650 RepID=A0A420XQG2_9ACTN|nr:alpha/beta hydrolase fold domain-containing protein [Motilibacter peucedani]RKS75538.1 acetyl esterase/lipase [Motilibacter peucedani]
MRRYDTELLAGRDRLLEVDPDADLATHRAALAEAMAHFARESDDEVETRDVTVAGEGRPLRLRVHEPRAGVTGGLLWLHGGAFSLGEPGVDDDLCQELAVRHGLLVAAPDYRLAPEHPFPAAERDAAVALSWLQRELAATVAADAPSPRRLVVAGASAGGSLALRTTLHAVAAGSEVERLVLVYPVVHDRQDSGSMRRYTTAPVFDSEQAELMWDRYRGPAASGPWPSPLLDDRLPLLPHTLVLLAEHDPLRDEELELVRALLDARVPVHARLAAGTYHAYDRFAPQSRAAAELWREVHEFLARPPLAPAEW